MKTKTKILALFAASAFAPSLFAQLTIPYADGSDGVLNITTNTVIDLSQAVTGVWTNTSGNPGKGIYDASQWAIIFKYSSVNIASNMTVTFINHYSHAPVVWLVSGSATINGTLSLDGQPGSNGSEIDVVEPGPGGFRGGAYSSTFSAGAGFGPGGPQVSQFGSGGQYIDYPYGTTNIVPLIGGSGGSGGYGNATSGGGAGGAILIAAANSITVNGNCHANGALGGGGNNNPGSGGALRLVANQILGSGQLTAIAGYKGRIRIEANTVANTLVVNPPVIGVVPANPPVIFPATNAPTVTVISVGGVAAPADPKAIMSSSPGVDDISIATITNQVTIQLQTKNFPTNGTVNVYVKPRNGGQSLITATFVSGNSNQATWQAFANLPYPPSQQGHTVIQARAVLP